MTLTDTDKRRLQGFGLILSSAVMVAATNLTFNPVKHSQLTFLSASQANSLIRLSTSLVALSAFMTGKRLLNKETEDKTDDDIEVSNTLPVKPLLDVARDSTNNPHIMIVGKTGGGKSTLAQYLAALSPGKRYVLSPHFDRTKSDWSACHGIFGTGRNYGTEEDDSIEYSDLITGNVQSPTAYQVLKAILSEMDSRYRQEIAFESHECHNWIIDESPAVARALDKLFSVTIAPILFESRKVNIRLWIISQSDQVETLRIRGQGKLREQFSHIYLANSAVSRLKTLKKRPPLTTGRWCVVDEEVSSIPDLSEMSQVIESNEVPERFIANFPDEEPTLPSVTVWLRRPPNDIEVELLRRKVDEITEDNPDISDGDLIKSLGFKGKYYNLGKDIWRIIS